MVHRTSFDPTIGDKGWWLISCCPMNRRILIQNERDIAMAWLDEIDKKFYYAPQGGLVYWTPTHWAEIPDGPEGILSKGF